MKRRTEIHGLKPDGTLGGSAKLVNVDFWRVRIDSVLGKEPIFKVADSYCQAAQVLRDHGLKVKNVPAPARRRSER